MFLVNPDLIQFFVSWNDISFIDVEWEILGFWWILFRFPRFLEFNLNFECYLFISLRVDLDLQRLVNPLDWTGEIQVTSLTQAWGF